MPFSRSKRKYKNIAIPSEMYVSPTPPSMSLLRSSPSSHYDRHSQHIEPDLFTMTATPNPNRNDIHNSLYDKTNYNTKHQHNNGNFLTTLNRKHNLSTPSATSSAGRYRNKQSAPTNLSYQHDTNNEIQAYINSTSPTTTATSSTYIPNLNSSNHLDRTTTTVTLHQQKSPISPRYIPTHHHPPPTLYRSQLTKTRNYLELPNKTTTTKVPFGEHQTSTMRDSPITISLLSDDENEIQDTSSCRRYPRSLENEAIMNHLTGTTSTTAIHDPGDISTVARHHKRQKMDDDSNVALDTPLPLEPHELFRKSYKSEPKRETRPKGRRTHRTKDNSKTYETKSNGLTKMLAAITLGFGQEAADMDEKQELTFFDDETPKDNRQESKQPRVNGFDGFSDDDDVL